MKDKKAISFQKKRCDCLIWPMFVYSKKKDHFSYFTINYNFIGEHDQA